MESSSVNVSDVVSIYKDFQIVNQVVELLVISVVVSTDYRNPIVDLVSERVRRVVHNYYVLQVPSGKDPQVLDVNALSNHT